MKYQVIVSAIAVIPSTGFAATPGDWCETLKASTSCLYEDVENPYIQSFKIGNRLNWQTYYITGQDQAAIPSITPETSSAASARA